MTDLIEVKTADLAGEALGWAVGTAEGLELILAPPEYGNPWRVFARYRASATEHDKRYNPWEDWALAGQLIEKYRVSLNDCGEHWGFPAGSQSWRANTARIGYGSNPLGALCRCIVLTLIGDTVLVPKELMP
ncbi:DUF2591 domain-containing protein [Pseudomonas asiatica]|uniref:DUF2591 domain-containing protein n=1 Tax=Pseudomonas asiatica TaxID=2219225 RepID=UPI0010C1208E|nr:DUF2591 domain-containing protein [Pseudomonas asiatica]